ncbi:hypothetical protein CVT25_003570 [Psilocybe cyanescens]|uniref:Uncharacterized protein n=1 Tax=Psilocybe cyanescens TaxID=93625 RepID=A0A409WNY4_PSICY|nr:hypothetical protein CVT25_003570 [Psilocybe cyanescens]
MHGFDPHHFGSDNTISLSGLGQHVARSLSKIAELTGQLAIRSGHPLVDDASGVGLDALVGCALLVLVHVHPRFFALALAIVLPFAALHILVLVLPRSALPLRALQFREHLRPLLDAAGIQPGLGHLAGQLGERAQGGGARDAGLVLFGFFDRLRFDLMRKGNLGFVCFALVVRVELCGGAEGTYNVGVAVIEAFGLELLLLALEGLELLGDVGIDEVGDVLAFPDFGHNVHLPFWVGEQVVLCEHQAVFSKTNRKEKNNNARFMPALLELDIALEPLPLGVVLVVLLPVLDSIRDVRRADNIVSRLRLRDMDAVDDRVNLGPLHLGVHAVREERIARPVLDLHDAFFRVAGNLHVLHVLLVDDLLDHRAGVRVHVFEAFYVDFVNDEQGGFSGE